MRELDDLLRDELERVLAREREADDFREDDFAFELDDLRPVVFAFERELVLVFERELALVFERAPDDLRDDDLREDDFDEDLRRELVDRDFVFVFEREVDDLRDDDFEVDLRRDELVFDFDFDFELDALRFVADFFFELDVLRFEADLDFELDLRAEPRVFDRDDERERDDDERELAATAREASALLGISSGVDSSSELSDHPPDVEPRPVGEPPSVVSGASSPHGEPTTSDVSSGRSPVSLQSWVIHDLLLRIARRGFPDIYVCNARTGRVARDGNETEEPDRNRDVGGECDPARI